MPSYFGGLILPSRGGTCSFRGSISGVGVGVGAPSCWAWALGCREPVIRATNSIVEAMMERDRGRIRFMIEGKK